MSAFKDLLQQAEALLRQATNGSQSQASELRQNAEELLEKVRTSSQTLQEEAVDKAKQVGDVAQTYVKENPWKAVGIAASLPMAARITQRSISTMRPVRSAAGMNTPGAIS